MIIDISTAVLSLQGKSNWNCSLYFIEGTPTDAASFAAQTGWSIGADETGTSIDFEGGPPCSWADVQAELAALQSAQVIFDEISRLETMPRRVRENFIALGATDQVIIDEEAAIVTERAKL
jgi:hypothetical protein